MQPLFFEIYLITEDFPFANAHAVSEALLYDKPDAVGDNRIKCYAVPCAVGVACPVARNADVNH